MTVGAVTLAAFVTGLVGSVHCVGMCGGIVASLAWQRGVPVVEAGDLAGRAVLDGPDAAFSQRPGVSPASNEYRARSATAERIAMTRTRQVLFIQGGGAGAHDEWDDKLVDSLRQHLGDGYEVRYPRMPGEDDPSYARWSVALRRELVGRTLYDSRPHARIGEDQGIYRR